MAGVDFDAAAVSRAYAEGAADYGTKFGDDLFDNAFDRAVLTSVLSGGDGLLLDCGCGPAQVARLGASLGRSVIGFDLTPEMLGLARTRLDAPLVLGDMRGLPFRPASLGAIACWFSLHNFPRHALGAVLAEIARAIRPGGTLVLATHGGHGEAHYGDVIVTYYETSELTALLQQAGFDSLVARTRPPQPGEHAVQKLLVSGRRVDADR
jgi:ubiquinone/menaquinone biosynthesis C-methylase UbiE